ncbi:MAG: tetratricopeptide repeat protein [Planctomycetota bacterium]|jgi:TolA-binding protein
MSAGCRTQFVIALAVISLLFQRTGTVSAKTWHLAQSQQWRTVSAESQDKYLLAVAEIKQLVNAGRTEAASNALIKLKEDFPEIAGLDLDAFIKAEMLFAKGKFAKAAKAYDKLVTEHPESELYEAALERQFAIATAFLAGRKRPILKVFKIRGYSAGAKIMGNISDRAGEAPIAIKAAISVAESLEKRGKFNEAYFEWSQISSRWPTGQTARNALFGMARCKHAAYRGPKYNASELISAKSYYENFKLRYPKDAEKIGIDKILRQIDEQQAYKQFNIGQYYQKTGNKQSANLYYQLVLDDWPKSEAAEKAKQKMGKK